ncbi:hypothetical protein PISL3812_05216 [Talaromyces islandicus]|uniref:BTB domain transcription factor n=1 Tax=Talaromyces islandicus TaxID=28573 RepID=A0A0U1LXU5_TALIS|nr:hypothetical protein PISL3812_05216 [Talaromyces islandicus]
MPARTSTRQAAAKANKAFAQGAAGSKRKGSAQKGSLPKKGKKDEKIKEGAPYEKPSVTEEAQEIRPSEAWSDSQATVNKQPTEAPPQAPPQEHPQAPQKAEEPVTGGAVKEEEESKQPVPDQESKKSPVREEDQEEKQKAKTIGTPIRESAWRGNMVPSTILEKGIIYFFFRPRVNVEDPHSMNEVARSFFVLRPTPKSAQIQTGPLGGVDNCRLMMLPKKKFPSSGRERDMGFVEKANVSLKTLQETFIAKSSYETTTRGERTTPEARPYAEGVYAIIKEGRSSHLAYMLTVPDKLGDIQTDFGLYGRGSFVVQSKNPKYPGPESARLPKGPEFPAEVMAKFRDLRWVPTEPELLDYPNSQFLMIGEAQDNLGKAGEALPGAEKETKERPADELGKLEGENEERVDALAGDHTIFDNLGLDAKKYGELPKVWD